MSCTYIGIDPGKGGAISWIDHLGQRVVNLKENSPADLLYLLRGLAKVNHCWAFIEMVAPMPSMPDKDGNRRSMGATSAFNFGREFERPQMLCLGAGVPFNVVLPKEWQRAVGLVYPKGLSHAQKKRFGKARAQELLSDTNIRVTQINADALMIAIACRRIMSGREATEGSIQ